jgi:hypothetical protein
MPSVPSTPDRQKVANAGLFFVCHQLSKLGWNVLPTSRNAKGVDIVAYPPGGSKPIMVQVKALTNKRYNVQLGKTKDGLLADYYVICVGEMKLEEMPECFVFTSEEAKSKPATREYKGKYWLQKVSLNTENLGNWDKIKAKE